MSKAQRDQQHVVVLRDGTVIGPFTAREAIQFVRTGIRLPRSSELRHAFVRPRLPKDEPKDPRQVTLE